MSFWGGFVEGFSEKVTEAIDKDVARTDKLVDDTIKIGIQKTLDTQEEIKKDKRRIKGELEMLTSQGFSLPKAASIVKAGMTTSIIKLKNDSDYKGKADGLWDGTTKFAEDNKLTVQDVINKLSYQPPLDFGNLNVAPRKTGILSALGLSSDIDSRIKEGVQGRVGSMGTAEDRGDISILPGSIPLTAKAQFDTEKNLTMDQEILKLKKKKIRDPKNFSNEDRLLLEDLEKFKQNTFVKQLASGVSNTGGVKIMTEQDLKQLVKKAQDGDKEAESTVEAYLLDLATKDKLKAKNLANSLGVSILENN